MSTENDTDLSLVTTKQLITELMSRHDAVVMVREVENVKGTTDTLYDYEGSISRAIGMAHRFIHKAMSGKVENESEADDR